MSMMVIVVVATIAPSTFATLNVMSRVITVEGMMMLLASS
jgi:hypothetical protein